MLYFAVFIHAILIAVLLYRRLWSKVPYLDLIVVLGIIGSILLHYENGRITDHSYLILYYGTDAIMVVLYMITLIKLRTTALSPIALSQLMFLSIKFTAWAYLLLGFNDARIDYSCIARALNLPLIAFWILVVWFYGEDARKGDFKMRDTSPATPVQQPNDDPDGPVPGQKPTGH
jgi:hypothetical protein